MAQSYNDRRRVLQGGSRRRLMCACGITSDLCLRSAKNLAKTNVNRRNSKSSMYSRRNRSERGLSKQLGNILEVEDNRLRFDMALACFDRTIDWRCPICHRLIDLGETEDNLRNLQRSRSLQNILDFIMLHYLLRHK